MLFRPAGLEKVDSSILPASAAVVSPPPEDRQGSVHPDVDVNGVIGDGDLRLEEEPIRSDHPPLAVPLERARASIGRLPVGLEHLEESVPLDGQVQWVLGLLEVSLDKELLNGHRPRSPSQQAARRELCSCGRAGADGAEGLIEQVLKICPASLKT